MKGHFCMTPGATAGAGGDNKAAEPFGFSFVDLTAGSADLGAVDPRFSFLTELPDTKVLLFRDSCNGLVLLEHREERLADRLGYIVCNPTTKEWAAVPACGSPTLQSANLPVPGVRSGGVLSLQLGPVPVWEQDEMIMKVVAVDVQGKGRRMIPVPQQPDSALWMCYFGQSQGRLHYMSQEMLGAREDRFKLSVWALEDYDAQEWVLKGAVNTREVFGENGGGGRNMEFEVVDIHQDRNVVFLTHPWEHDLVAYDMDREEVRTIATFGEQEELIGTARYVQCY
ncbi:unnamed protein product [Urochloa decumbens]|uniref:F-box associated domain-containing protein n=1 Tax=Urochloa decumbens TaxID=240449 RepID=A0ABC9HEL9_9POAL